MNKYFKNTKEVTVDSILKEYEKFQWSEYHFDLQPEKEKFKSLVNQCKQLDSYIDWQEKKKILKEDIYKIKVEIEEIETNKIEIVIRNSEQQYEEVYKNLKNQLLNLERELNKLENNKPPSKRDMLSPIYKKLEKQEKIADQNFRRMEQQNRRNAQWYETH